MSITLHVNGKDAFEAIFSAIDNAKQSLHIQMFIWRADSIGIALASHVLSAAERGVKVTIAKDLMGGVFEFAEEQKTSFFHLQLPVKLRMMSIVLDKGYPMKGKPRHVHQTRLPVAEALLNHPNITVSSQRQTNDHSKFYLIDDHLLILGGINVEDKEVTSDLLGRPYHDFMATIDSHSVCQNFRENQQSNQKPKLLFETGEIDFICNRILPTGRQFHAKEKLLGLIGSTKVSLHIVMAYIGDPDIMQAITEATGRGIKVFLYLSDRANLQNDLNRLHLKRLMAASENKVNVYLCKDMIHGKLLWFDEDLVTFGSTNLNKQAMSVLQELNVIYSSVAYGHQGQLKNAILRIQEKSTPILTHVEISYNPLATWIENMA